MVEGPRAGEVCGRRATSSFGRGAYRCSYHFTATERKRVLEARKREFDLEGFLAEDE